MSNSSLNPLLAKVRLPGRVFQLPSKGLFYEPGVLADSVKDGEIHIHPMSAIAELKVRSADLLLSTKVIEEICAECVPEIRKPSHLLSLDVDALFLFLVATTYGNKKTIRSIHTCNDAKIHDYEVSLEPILSNPRNESLAHREVIYSFKLENGQLINLRPINFQDAVDIMLMRQQLSDKQDKSPHLVTSEDQENIIIRDLISVIESVTSGDELNVEIRDPKMISEWLHLLSRPVIDSIYAAAFRANDWGFKFTVKLKCKDCDSEFDHDMELNPVNFLSG